MINNLQFPEKGLYVVGSKIVKMFVEKTHASINIVNLYDDYERNYGYISYPYFIYALDWLFIIGIIDLNKKGELTLCN